MQTKMAHLSDQELLLLAASELSASAALKAQLHLAECNACQVRSEVLKAALDDIRHLPVPASSTDALRNRLISQMQQTENATRPRAARLGVGFSRLALPCIALLLLVLAGRSNLIKSAFPVALFSKQVATLPVKTLTPGAIQSIALNDLCRTQGSTARVEIDDSVAREVFEEYGVPFASRNAYEVDYLITPGLGGSSDIRNLWPEPDQSTDWNAHVKDVLEDHLHTLVCEGKLPLATAQAEISGNWITAYKKQFHTEAPLRATVSQTRRTRTNRAG